MGQGGGEVVDGWPRAVVLDGETTWFWSGCARDDGRDVIAVDPRRRALTWSAREDALAEGERHGWVLADEQTREGAEETTDLMPAQQWSSRRSLALPTASVLGLWSMAGDVATSTGAPWSDRGAVRDRCYRKLFAAEVPAVFDLEGYRPSWTAREVDVLRAVVAAGVHVLRTAVPRSRS